MRPVPGGVCLLIGEETYTGGDGMAGIADRKLSDDDIACVPCASSEADKTANTADHMSACGEHGIGDWVWRV